MTSAVIIAAGRGSRLAHLTDSVPKCMMRIHGETLLDRQLSNFEEMGIYSIAAVVGYKKEAISARGIPVFINSEWNITGIFHSLMKADRWLSSVETIVSYGDIFYPQALINELLESAGDIVVCFDPDWLDLWSARSENPLTDAESFRVSPEGILQDIGGKVVSAQDVQGQYMGLMKFTPKGWEELKALSQSSGIIAETIDITSILSAALDHGAVINTLACRGEWGEVDTPSDLDLYNSRQNNASR
ncbi:NTP transferase domain-containing protein [Serratia plymuthica]|uniref:Bifunctional N-acetylglucosamine-1-phosphate uridyltransferase/glucosamine-1-phosphate acetyltransferase n=1 Tax=Serratia plymuthica TaxID=82996 RepID=A0A2X4UGT6_SERPL|nr:phosphocholine cytidylyltransferase family protein [Serratia plymuthica]QPS22000.1 phosphocholine cytidylyltransferase family protein [Serratia plymuthica]QPS63611.1 phosphocholine cytidylyltransferase family protein [Serratia plymuthica]RKS64020.1 choline kinase [Serratia plymuthica]CAI2488660.1 bifunctional N-acetylglucosamine-1-phosphate uridyltransferase/glucosamine-1-phosphate acetyltransferase [Serratia plymuthica]SQI33772.1 bifunctional N-acetylglucosamine-1-phosphate uridyltransfera